MGEQIREYQKRDTEVNEGNLNYKIPTEGEDELDQLAAGINRISEAASNAVDNEIKNQRMKTDLISNVSHDLKTPLTSMVTYIDLLKNEGLDSENAPKYVDILEQKTNQLQKLTEDLFEAAKASSGAIPVRMGKVDLLSLVNQGLGEMDQRMEDSGLEVIMGSPKERYLVNADGQLLWRVLENLLGNVIKYSQENTRVYINIKEIESAPGLTNMVLLEIKNISKHSLNINPSELMERFKRGDSSRTTEGSGLGLAIAKDLMKLMSGWLELDIDGDLFKARIMLTADRGRGKRRTGAGGGRKSGNRKRAVIVTALLKSKRLVQIQIIQPNGRIRIAGHFPVASRRKTDRTNLRTIRHAASLELL